MGVGVGVRDTYPGSWGRNGTQICTVHIEDHQTRVYTDIDPMHHTPPVPTRQSCSRTLRTHTHTQGHVTEELIIKSLTPVSFSRTHIDREGS